jgi:hypothetical protein
MNDIKCSMATFNVLSRNIRLISNLSIKIVSNWFSTNYIQTFLIIPSEWSLTDSPTNYIQTFSYRRLNSQFKMTNIIVFLWEIHLPSSLVVRKPIPCNGYNFYFFTFGFCILLRIYLTSSLWRRQSQQSFNTLAPFNFLFLLTTCFGPYWPSSSEIYNYIFDVLFF